MIDMKILMLGSKEYPFGSSKISEPKPGGGIEKVVEGLSKYLSRNGHEVFVITRRFPGQSKREDKGKVHVYRTIFLYNRWLRTFTFNLFAFYKALRLIKRERIDMIHSHGFVAGFFGSILSKLTKTPLVFTPHGVVIDWPSPAKEGLLFFHKVILRHVKRIIFISSASDYVKKRTLRGKQIPNSILDYGIDMDDFNISSREWKDVRFIYLGRFARHKGVLHTIQAFSKLVKSFKNSKLYIAGSGMREREILDCIKENNLEKYVNFMGQVNPKDVPSVLSQVDVFVLPSIETGQPVALLEAMAAGKIIITSLKYIDDGKDGISVKQDVDDIYRKMLHVCENFEKCKKLGKNARENVKKKDWSIVIKDFEREYEEVLVK
jgi:glycosyltransferase involved in cell wall biosynthesis